MDKKRRPYIIAVCEICILIVVVSVLLVMHRPPVISRVEGLQILYQSISTPEDIRSLSGTRVPPIAYTNVVSFEGLQVGEKKKKFFDLLLPAVLISKHKLLRQRERVLAFLRKDHLTDAEKSYLDRQMKRFKAGDYDELLRKMQVHPTSIVLAQAAIETGWGASRFFRNANNVFGIWSFQDDEARVRARETRDGKVIYVKKYASLIESVDDYFLTLAKGPYKEFRKARVLLTDPWQLSGYLTKYSEQGDEYIRKLHMVINANNLVQFDTFQVDPAFISGG
ncbi:MAG: glucosaminidase domain-containing protein [Desulfobulbaceae bacterium]|nr:glucosaminidase domain-containing protein [Desulfobulbaceae bacterium]